MRQIGSVDAVARFGAGSLGRTGRDQRLQPGGPRSVEFTENQARDPAVVLDHPGLGDAGEDVDDPAHHEARTQRLAQHALGLDAVLQCHHGGALAEQRAQASGQRRQILHLHRDQQVIAGPRLGRVGEDRGLGDMHVAQGGADGQPPAGHGLAVCAAGDEPDVVAAGGETGAEIATHPAGADDHESHGLSPAARPGAPGQASASQARLMRRQASSSASVEVA